MTNITFKKLTYKEISIFYEDYTNNVVKDFLIKRYEKLTNLVNCYHLVIRVCKDYQLFEDTDKSDYIIEFYYVIKELSTYNYQNLSSKDYIYYAVEETKPTIDYELREFKINNIIYD
jgi:hypothetical protein